MVFLVLNNMPVLLKLSEEPELEALLFFQLLSLLLTNS